MKKLLVPVTAAAVLFATLVPRSLDVNTVECYPAPDHDVLSVLTTINLETGGTLLGKFYYPDPGSGNRFETGSLSGIVVTHGGGASYVAVEADAARLATECFVVLIYNFRGQGPHEIVDTLFTYMGDLERSDLIDITNWLIQGPAPVPVPTDLVDDSLLGATGHSQGGTYSWLMASDHDTRGRYRALAPQNGFLFSSDAMLPNDCFDVILTGELVGPANVRPPYTPLAPTEDGVTRDPTLHATLYSAFVNQSIEVWQTAIATRQPPGEFLTPNHPLTPTPPPLGATFTPIPHPNMDPQVSWYDQQQIAHDVISGYQTVTPPVRTPGFPEKRFQAIRDGHAANPWRSNATEEAYKENSRIQWFHAYLGPFFTQTPTPTMGSPVNTPTIPAYEYQVDRYNPPNVTNPAFELKGSTTWPPPEAITLKLYLRETAPDVFEALTGAPGPAEGFDEIGQDFVPGSPAYNLATAIAQKPLFDTWATAFPAAGLRTLRFRSLPLAQDVTLMGAPKVELYGEQGTPLSNTYQAHIRVLEEFTDADATTQFITRANNCAWNAATPPPRFAGALYDGEARAHKFRAGSRIVLEVTTIDQEYYRPNNSRLFITPYLNDFGLKIWHQQDKPTNIRLPIVKSGPGPIFEGGDLGPENAPQAAPTASPTALAPEPLTMVAWVKPEFTNPGGWHAWAPQVWFNCAGGEGEITCPDIQYLAQDGLDQSYTFEAHDEAGNVATVTVSGLNIDRTAPQLVETLPDSLPFCSTGTLPVVFSVTDALSGLAVSNATFNGEPVNSGQMMPLEAGANTLRVYAQDAAGNGDLPEASVQVNYDETLLFPPDGEPVIPTLPLPFKFTINDTCSVGGKYGQAVGTLWLTGPDGVEQPAEWFGSGSGNTFTYDSLTGWYNFDADVSGLGAGTWAARLDLDDGNDYTTTFVVP